MAGARPEQCIRSSGLTWMLRFQSLSARPWLSAVLLSAVAAACVHLRKAYATTPLARRVALACEPCPSESEVGKPLLVRMLREAEFLLEPLRKPFRKLDIIQTCNPQTVMIMPGFAAHPVRMRYLASQLEAAGHCTRRWGLGFNWGPDEVRFERLAKRLGEIHARRGQKVVLVGWSLGGLFAREVAKRRPDAVAKVITMGSPFSGSPRANNLWRLYQFLTGHPVDAPPVDVELAVKPPVETVALWSAQDAVVAPRCAAGWAGERDRAIALRCTHMGFSYDAEVIQTLLEELEITRD